MLSHRYAPFICATLALFLAVAGCDSDDERRPRHDTFARDTVPSGEISPGHDEVTTEPGGEVTPPGPLCPRDSPPCDAALPGLLISELQAAPCVLSNEQGQWFEVLNVGDEVVDLTCWTIEGTVPESENHLIEPPEGVLAASPNHPLVLARSAEWARLTDNVSDYVYGDDILLRRSAEGRLALRDHCGNLVVELQYGGEGWPARECRSLQLSPDHLDPEHNDDPAAWCQTPGDGDAGTPGAANVECPIDPHDLCDPNPCNIRPPNTCSADGLSVLRYSAEGVCTPLNDDSYQCDYQLEERIDCAARGGRCEGGECVDEIPAPTEGQVIFTEIMYNPRHDLNDPDGEWFEIKNISPTPLFLGGCIITNLRDNHPMQLDPLLLAPGELALFARSAYHEFNGGLDPLQTFGFQLVNAGDSLTLTCGAVQVDRVEYSTALGFPVAAGRSLSLDPGAFHHQLNDIGANWCTGSDVYYEDSAGDPERHNHGTPGTENPPCFPRVAWCRLQPPLELERRAGESIEVFGRVFEPGVTPTGTTEEIAAAIIGEVGIGPVGTRPDLDPDGDWSYVRAAPNPAHVPDNERADAEYVAALAAPAPGTYSFAYRFKLASSPGWQYCDGDTGHPGEDGSEDGYQPDNAGHLMSLESACFPNPCVEDAPFQECSSDGLLLVTYSGEGQCLLDGAGFECHYPEESSIDCALRGGYCEAGECVHQAPAPSLGQVIFTEIMYNPSFDLADAHAEWFEMMNVSSENVFLGGCRISDINDDSLTVDPLVLAPGGLVLFVRSTDRALNGGLDPFQTFSFFLRNTSDSLTLTCEDAQIDHVEYNQDLGFPPAVGRSLSLDPGAFDHESNTLGENWCLAKAIYYEDAGGDPERHNLGTPGAVNPPCFPEVEWCRLQRPLDQWLFAGEKLSIYGRVRAPGITDLSAGVDLDYNLVGQAGVGPAGSDPTATPEEWDWFVAGPSPDWDGELEGEPDNDEYVAHLAAPEEGSYHLAFRFSLDAGERFVYCDRNTGHPGEDGSENGYQVANAGALSTTDSDCHPNPCEAPPSDICEDERWLLSYARPGWCTVLTEGYECVYQPDYIDCAAEGAICLDGLCRAE